MKVNHNQGTSPYSKYTPECFKDCEELICSQCVFDKYNTNGITCPYKRYLRDLPVKKPTNEEDIMYQPGCIDDCQGINCTECVFYKFRTIGDDCPFRKYIIAYPVEKPTPTDRLGKACELLVVPWGLLPSGATPVWLRRLGIEENNTELSKVADALAEINQSIIKLGEILQEQPPATCSAKNSCNYSTEEFLGLKKK